MREFKSVPSEVKSDGKTPGRWRQTFSVFNNVDDGGDRVMHGAFKRTLEENGPPPVIWSHQWDTPPIGQSLDADEKRGRFEVLYQLFVREGEDHPVARMVDAGLSGGALKEGSFGYETVKTKSVEEDGKSIRELLDLDLFEVSPTLVGMNRATRGQLQAASIDARVVLGDVFRDDDELFERFTKSIAGHLWTFSQSGISVPQKPDDNLDDEKSINLTDAEEAAAPSPEEDERRAAQLAEINRLKHLIPR